MGSEVSYNQPSRTIFIGDVHGCLDELKDLLVKLKVNSKKFKTSLDRVILLGDLVNKGPYSIDTVNYVCEAGFECLLGNNDAYYLQFKQAYLKEVLPKKVLRWFQSLPYYISEPHFIAVHAGLHPHYSLESSPKKILLHIREYEFKPWYEYYQDERPIIYGHWAKQGLTVRHNTVGLDSGCVYGKKLTAYILETKEIVQVTAKQAYMKI